MFEKGKYSCILDGLLLMDKEKKLLLITDMT